MDESIRLIETVLGEHLLDVSELSPATRVQLTYKILGRTKPYLDHLKNSFQVLAEIMKPSPQDCDARYSSAELENSTVLKPADRCVLVIRLREVNEGEILMLRGQKLREHVRRSELLLTQCGSLVVWDQHYRRVLQPHSYHQGVVREEHTLRSKLWLPHDGEMQEILTCAAMKAVLSKVEEIVEKGIKERQRRLENLITFKHRFAGMSARLKFPSQ